MKRYQMGYPNNGMDENLEGRWVTYSEAQDLEHRNIELRTALAECLQNTGGGGISAAVIERATEVLNRK